MLITPPSALAIEPDEGQLTTFVHALFKYATSGTNASIRAFPQDRQGKALFIRTFEIEPDDNLRSVIKGAVYGARDAAKAGAVFSPPVCVFTRAGKATEKNLAQGLVIAIECDSRPQWALKMLTMILGKPAIVVASDGQWTDPVTGEVEDKLHLYWRLATPANDVETLKKLKHARKMATFIVGADASNVPIVHPMRWPGSWHLKNPNEPRLCHIIESNDVEITLDAAFDVLRAAAPDVEAPTYAEAKTTTPATPRNEFQKVGLSSARGSSPLGDINEIASAMEVIPNPDLEWKPWKDWAMRICAATGGSEDGFKIFDRFSQLSKRTKENPTGKYNAAFTRQTWLAMCSSPPDRTGANKIFAEAIKHGWKTAPTHAPSPFTDIVEARRRIAQAIHNFFHPNSYQECARTLMSSAYAIKCETGVGKTEEAIKAIAAYVTMKIESVSHRVSKTGNAYTVTRQRLRRVGYGVATHRLGGEIELRFLDCGVEAATYRSRKAIDPKGDGEQLMCLVPDKVKLAIEARQEIERTCCRKGSKVCEFFDRCGFQRQKEKIKNASVVIFASDMIFHSQPIIGKLDDLFLDESFSLKQCDNEIEISLTALSGDADEELVRLAKTLMKQPEDGALRLNYAAYASDLMELRVRLLNEMPKLEFNPVMSAAAMQSFARRNKALIRRAVLYRNLGDVLPDIDAMWSKDIEVSGRLFLDTDKDTKARILRWRGVRKVTAQFDASTFVMDATLPSLDILRLTHPHVRQVADIRVAMPPSVRIVQVIGAPTSKTKLIAGPHKEKHQQGVVRYIVRRWLECGRGKALVIAQQEFEKKILRRELPEEIALLHFNALSGVDAFKDVRLAIVIGRTLPKSLEVEALAATLSGAMPECVTVDDDDEENEGLRYERVKRGIRLRDGTGRAVRVNAHPDELCEALRWQACEGELMQALGRARGINRTDETPLDLDLLFDEALPIEVDAVENWERPSLFFETAREGVMLSSVADLMTIWPDLFPNHSAADRALADGLPDLPGFVTVSYKIDGPKQKWRSGDFDLSLVADPMGWLSERLGGVTVRAKSRADSPVRKMR